MTPELENKTEISVKTIDKNNSVTTTSRARTTRKVKSGMFDVPEIVAVSLAGAALLGVVLAYFFLLLPARENVGKSKTELAQKQSQLLNLQEKANDLSSKASSAADVVASIDRFEMTSLPVASTGNAALYQRLNELIRSNGLRNTAGPEYAPLETIDAAKAVKAEGRAGKQQSIFPGTYVTVTVEGNYANLRRFISDLEATRQFLIINAVEIESNGEGGSNTASTGGNDRATSAVPTNPMTGIPNPTQPNPNKINPRAGDNGLPNMQQQPAPMANQNKRGAVSLRLEMAAYFRRPTTIQTPNAAK